MNNLNGGYIMINLANAAAALATLKNTNGTKPVLVYDAVGIPYYAKDVKVVGTSVTINSDKGIIVIKADGTVVKSNAITDITKIPGEILSAVECGEVIVKKTTNQYHSYRVSYKEENTGICLTYVDATTVETVSYDYTDNTWVYNSTDKTTLTPDA